MRLSPNDVKDANGRGKVQVFDANVELFLVMSGPPTRYHLCMYGPSRNSC